MTRQPQYIWTLFPVLAVCLLSAAQNSNQPLPPVMHFCAYNCMTLTLQGDHYVVTAESGVKTKDGRTVTGTWTVESFSPESVILRRVDATGFTGVYKGQISKDGNRLVNITLDGKPNPKMRLTWGTALNETPGSNAQRDYDVPPPTPDVNPTLSETGASTQENLHSAQGPSGIPGELIECENNQCETKGDKGSAIWLLDGNHGDAQWGYGAHGKLTVERFDDSGVVIHRVDPAGTQTPGLTGDYTGKRNGDRIDGTVVWTWPNVWSKPITGTWYATIAHAPPCNSKTKAGVSAQSALRRGQVAYWTKEYQDALCWMEMSSGMGNRQATLALAVFYDQGIGVIKNEEAYFHLLDQAASMPQKDGNQKDEELKLIAIHLLAECFKNGTGTAKDVTKYSQLETIVMMSPVGQNILMSIDNTPEQRAGYDRLMDAIGKEDEPEPGTRWVTVCPAERGCYAVEVPN